MPKTNPLLLTLAVVPAALLGACGGSSWNTSHYHAHLLPLEPPPGAQDIMLSTNFGDLDVAPVGETAPTWAAKHYGGQVPAEAYLLAIAQSQDEDRPAEVTFETRWSEDGFSVIEHWPGGMQSKLGEGVDYVLRVPEIGGVRLYSDFGDIDVLGVTGVIHAESDFGDITIHAENAPEATLLTDHGDIEVYRIAGPVTMETSFGDIEAEHIAGPVKALSDHGDIDLILTPTNPGPFIAITDFGDITVLAGPALQGLLEMDTDFGDTRFVGVIEGGTRTIRSKTEGRDTIQISEGVRSEATTSHGDVRVSVAPKDDSTL